MGSGVLSLGKKTPELSNLVSHLSKFAFAMPRGHSRTTWTNFCPILTTYLLIVDFRAYQMLPDEKKLIFCQYFFFLWTRLFLKHTIDFLDFGPHGYYTDYLPTFRGQSWTFDWPPKYLLHLVHVVFELPPIHTSHGLIDRKGYYIKI